MLAASFVVADLQDGHKFRACPSGACFVATPIEQHRQIAAEIGHSGTEVASWKAGSQDSLNRDGDLFIYTNTDLLWEVKA